MDRRHMKTWRLQICPPSKTKRKNPQVPSEDAQDKVCESDIISHVITDQREVSTLESAPSFSPLELREGFLMTL